MSAIPTFSDIEAAAERIAPWAVATPVLENPALNARAGRRVLLKLEIFQRTGSFKFRGALNRIRAIPEAERGRGIVAFSSGNHAQGVAAAAQILGLPAAIVMPADAPAAKLAGTRALGAEVILYDRHREDREAIAADLCQARGATLVRPFDDPAIVAGQGTAGLEFVRQAAAVGARLDTLLVPCSGGGLASGIALAFSQSSPQTRILVVEPESFDGMGRSLAAGERVSAPGGPSSLADALMAPVPGVLPFEIAKGRIAGGLTVADDDLARAVSYAAKTLKIVVEPGGAAALAALLAGRVDMSGDPLGLVISGGNCDPETLSACCSRVPAP
jgi:threonine dehydratase